jgi:hypothetical protein
VHSASQDGRAAGVPYGLVAEAPPQLLREVSQPDSMLLRNRLRNRIIYLYLKGKGLHITLQTSLMLLWLSLFFYLALLKLNLIIFIQELLK